jgi:hypothetical protein
MTGCSPQDASLEAGTSSPEAFLERVRAAAAALHEKDPSAPVIASGDAAAAAAFAAFGEAEEIDAWRFPQDVPKDALADLRKTFDASGGKAVAFLTGSESYAPRFAAAAGGKLKGRAGAPLLVAGTGRVYVIAPDGRITWEKKGCGNVHCARLHDGHVYYANGALYRVPYPCAPDTRPVCVWRPQVPQGGGVLGFTIAPDGAIVMALNSTSEILELKDGREVVRFKVDCRDDKGQTPGAHARLRMVRKTAQGTYLVCCAGAARVREYDKTGVCIWQQRVPVLAFDCHRRANGNTLVGHVSGVTEYTPDHQVAWSFDGAQTPSLRLSCFCSVQETPEGHFIFGTWSNGEPDGSKATACEITREKKAVWAWYPTGDANMMSVIAL